MQSRRHVFIMAGEPKTGKTILGDIVRNSPSVLVLDDFVICGNISEHLINELNFKDPFPNYYNIKRDLFFSFLVDYCVDCNILNISII